MSISINVYYSNNLLIYSFKMLVYFYIFLDYLVQYNIKMLLLGYSFNHFQNIKKIMMI